MWAVRRRGNGTNPPLAVGNVKGHAVLDVPSKTLEDLPDLSRMRTLDIEEARKKLRAFRYRGRMESANDLT